MTKAALTGAAGFALGATLMMLPANQKLKRQMLKQTDRLAKMVKAW